MRRLACSDLFRRARYDNLSASVAAFRAEVDHVVCGLDDIHVVFDGQYRVACVHKSMQTVEQALDIGEVKSRGRLVENVECVFRSL